MNICTCLLSFFMTMLNFIYPTSCVSITDDLFSETRSYYEIKSIIDLKGKTIDLPKGSVIEFRGGEIRNGVLNCNENVFKGINGLSRSVKLKGTVKGPFDISVFCLAEGNKDFDLAPILNNVSQVCKNIIVPDGLYFFKTPIVLKDLHFYQQYGDLVYNGNEKSITAVQFYGGNSAVINIGGKISYDTRNKIINYTKNSKTNIIGVEFVNINNSSIYVGDVEYFNNNIRISGYGAGNSYNKYSIGISVFSNEHLRVFQQDFPAKQIGWCNENIFLGGRFCNWSHFDWKNCESVAISIVGSETGDTYNGANSLLFIKPCMEGFKNCAVYAKNVESCHWQDARTEGCGKFVRFEGNCRNNIVSSLYGTNVIDYSDSNTYPLVLDNLFPVFSASNSNNGKMVLEIGTAEAKCFRIVFGSNDSKGRLGVIYLKNKAGLEISVSEANTMKKPISTTHPNSYYYNAGSKSWTLASDSSKSDFVVPEDVGRIRLVLTGQFEEVTIYSNKSTRVTMQ